MKKYKETKIEMSRKMSNIAFSVVARSCNKILIGKTYWKSVVLPSVLTAGAVVDWNKTELDKLQRIENKVWRHVLGAPNYVAVEALRGEIGSATMEERDIKIKLCYAKHVLKGNNDLLREILHEMKENNKGSQWLRTVRGYMTQVNIRNMEELNQMTEENIKERVRKWGERKWRIGMEGKSTLTMYFMNKKEIKEENIYDNTFKSKLLFRCRTNSLLLNWRKRFSGGEEKCDICQQGESETLQHFLLHCEGLKDIRRKYTITENTTLEKVLLFQPTSEEDIEKYSLYVEELWTARKRKTDLALNQP